MFPLTRIRQTSPKTVKFRFQTKHIGGKHVTRLFLTENSCYSRLFFVVVANTIHYNIRGSKESFMSKNVCSPTLPSNTVPDAGISKSALFLQDVVGFTVYTKKNFGINSLWGFMCRAHSSGAVRESRWPSWAVRPNEPSGFRGRKELLNRASALVTTCP